MNYKWIEKKPTHVEINHFSVTHGIKKIDVYAEGNQVYINWYINNELVEIPYFPQDVVEKIHKIMGSLQYQWITNDLLLSLSQQMGEFLPFLESKECGDLMLVTKG